MPVTDEKERLAVAEHRLDMFDKTIERISRCLEKLTDNQTQTLLLQKEQSTQSQRITRLESKLEHTEERRVAQHEQTREWASEDRGKLNSNAQWIELSKQLGLALVSAVLTAAAAVASAVFLFGLQINGGG